MAGVLSGASRNRKGGVLKDYTPPQPVQEPIQQPEPKKPGLLSTINKNVLTPAFQALQTPINMAYSAIGGFKRGAEMAAQGKPLQGIAQPFIGAYQGFEGSTLIATDEQKQQAKTNLSEALDIKNPIVSPIINAAGDAILFGGALNNIVKAPTLAEQATANIRVTKNLKLTDSSLPEAVKELPSSQRLLLPEKTTSKIEVGPVKPSKPYTSIQDVADKNYNTVAQEYDDAIKTIQDYYGTNELRVNELHDAKTKFGIDFDNLTNRLQEAEYYKNNPDKFAERERMRLVSGAITPEESRYMDELANYKTAQQEFQKGIPKYELSPTNKVLDQYKKEQPFRVTPGEIGRTEQQTGNALSNLPQTNKNVPARSINVQNSNVLENERRFAQNVKTSPDTPQNVLNKLENEPLGYQHISNQKTAAKAAQIVNADPEGVYADLLSKKHLYAQDVANGEVIIKQAFESGNDKKAYETISFLAEKLTEAGRTVQAASMFKRMTPEGMLMYAEKLVKKANNQLELPGKVKGGFIDPLKKYYKKGNLTDEMKTNIKTAMEEAQKLPEGREKSIKMAEIMQTISDAMPKSPFGKVESFRTIAMLSNPKTWIRNLAGNAMFGAVEAGAEKPLASLIDVGLKSKTGQRSVLNTNLKELGQGFKEGAQNALSDVKMGIDTSPTRGALELPRANEFKNVPVVQEIEKAVKLGVSGGDRPFYEAAYKDALKEQKDLYIINTGKDIIEPTEEMKQAADEIAKYRTYADKNMISDTLTNVKSSLNKFRVGGIGAGDVLLKFTRTPANLVARGIDYSPAGLVKGIVDVARVLAGNSSIQRQAAQGLARGIIGTGFVSGAILLTNLGIVRGERAKSNTANAFEQASGKNQYSVNLSALNRLVSSGFDINAVKEQPGDKIATYDWAAPLALSAAAGANIGESWQKKQRVSPTGLVGTIVDSLESGANTIIEQPMLQSINRVFKGDNPVQGLASVVQDYPASFVPAFLQGMRYAADPYYRDTSGDFLQATGKRIVNKLPGFSRGLEKTTDILGNDKKASAETMVGRVFNAALNPTNPSKITNDKTVREISKVYKATNDGNVLPNLVEKTDTIPPIQKGEQPKELTKAQLNQYQTILANTYLQYARNLTSSNDWDSLPDDIKRQRLASKRSEADDIAKKKMQSIIYGK